MYGALPEPDATEEIQMESQRERDIRNVMGKMQEAAKKDPALLAAINRGRRAARRFNARLRAAGCTEAVDKSEQRLAQFQNTIN